MAIHVALHHRTRYKYDRPVTLGPQIVRLRPAPHSRARILSYSLNILPAKHFINWQQDPQANYLARLVFNEKTTEFSVEVGLVVEMAVFNPFDFFLEPEGEKFPFKYDPGLDHELAPFLKLLPSTPDFDRYFEMVRMEMPGKGGLEPAPRTIDFLVALNGKLWKDIRYLIRLEPGVQTPVETVAKMSGSCRDSAWLLCQLLRRFGLAARFVSGYLIQLAPDVKSLDGPSGPERDFTDLHAWCEVYLPGAGWIGLDPTSGLLAGEGHIPLAATPDPQSAAPISGVVDESECEFDFEMRVTRIYESPRTTKPYTEEQWAEINQLGTEIDADLVKEDVRLTMGGEPTFVSVDDYDGAEWNTAAMGPNKRRLGDGLMRRLQKRFAPGALLHYGQGKWYPGESLPRWAFAAFWRKDGVPVWEDPALFSDEKTKYGHNAAQAASFMASLVGRLGVDAQWMMPGYEDAWYHLWKERRLPTNVDPLKSNLKDEEERARLAKIFEQGLPSVVGYAIPIERRIMEGKPAWASGPWFLRPERLYLTPGDSPMGFRLPMDSLPWVTQTDYPYVSPLDPSAPRPPLPSRQAFVSGAAPARLFVGGQGTQLGSRAPRRGESADWIVRTAICVEPRQGRLHVFMPPTETLEDYLELVVAVENTARDLKLPVVVEGYPPPTDPRLNVIKVTPDPGVIEVNIHPSSNWTELVEKTNGIYEDAHASRLGAEKFMVDGRHTGTGGGNHIILGGATPQDSPLLRRPDLLRSLLAYWQNHPSLSFVFSGLFVGPTSQSPRVDEARNDSLYELEVAFQEVPDGRPCPPWLVDRIFRNLLADATGNTHRAEFSIDKLYSPDGSSGRLGLLEMRAFEMPPHAQMSLAQHLVLRGLVAKFWKQPYRRPLIRWGTDIHDRWMLPHYLRSDFQDVVHDLNEAGYGVKSDWFDPHFEFRFPLIGDVTIRDTRLELKQALEPWHVLGEEGAAGGAVRYVDSSIERLQVKLEGLVEGRHRVLCNGRTVPLRPTGTNGEAVAGVRYRAWQPPNCLHPTIPVHAPLTLDIVDTWNQRSLGGCTYHVSHPGGRGYTQFPVNAYEAESRRLSRFFRHGHTQGVVNATAPGTSPEFPFTLDLRHG